MGDMSVFSVCNDTVWRQIKYLLLGSAVLFLINVYFGFDNALTEGAIPRWQILIHLHAGSIGWITMSVIAIAVWIFTSGREVSDSLAGRIKNLTRLAMVAFGGYVISFGLAFSQGDNFFFLLPIFGTASALTIWLGAAFAISQYRKSEVKTAPQLMVTGALTITSLGALMGVLLGLENALKTTIIPGADRIGAHAGVMDGYLLLAASSIVAWFLSKNAVERFSRAALAQFLAFFLAPLVVWLGLIIDQEMLAGLSAPLIIIGVVIFALRHARDIFKQNPLKREPGSWVFFGSIWTVVWALVFAYVIVLFISGEFDAEGETSAGMAALFVLFAHAAFVGMMTNLILGMDSVRTYGSRAVLSWAEPAGLWLMNLGLIAFVAAKYFDSRYGAIVMGVGVLTGVGTMIVRLLSKEEEMVAASAAAD